MQQFTHSPIAQNKTSCHKKYQFGSRQWKSKKTRTLSLRAQTCVACAVLSGSYIEYNRNFNDSRQNSCSLLAIMCMVLGVINFQGSLKLTALWPIFWFFTNNSRTSIFFERWWPIRYTLEIIIHATTKVKSIEGGAGWQLILQKPIGTVRVYRLFSPLRQWLVLRFFCSYAHLNHCEWS